MLSPLLDSSLSPADIVSPACSRRSTRGSLAACINGQPWLDGDATVVGSIRAVVRQLQAQVQMERHSLQCCWAAGACCLLGQLLLAPQQAPFWQLVAAKPLAEPWGPSGLASGWLVVLPCCKLLGVQYLLETGVQHS